MYNTGVHFRNEKLFNRRIISNLQEGWDVETRVFHHRKVKLADIQNFSFCNLILLTFCRKDQRCLFPWNIPPQLNRFRIYLLNWGKIKIAFWFPNFIICFGELVSGQTQLLANAAMNYKKRKIGLNFRIRLGLGRAPRLKLALAWSYNSMQHSQVT